jgi:hypothetical protein
VLLVILIVVGAVIALLAVLKLVLVVWGRVERRVDRAVTARLAERHAPEEMLLHETMANFFGEESRGPAQMRGNGGLVLTRDALVFHMLVPDRTIGIPLEDIREVSLVRSHLGKRVGRDLVHVRYDVPDGTDAIAWFVRDPETWRRELEGRSRGATGDDM